MGSRQRRRNSKGAPANKEGDAAVPAEGVVVGPSTRQAKGTLINEKEAELSAIWGSERMGGRESDRRAPARKRRKGKGVDSDDDNDNDDNESVMSNFSVDSRRRGEKPDDSGKGKKTKSKKEVLKDKKKKQKAQYKLHCFIAPGTTKNDVREVFEMYEPKVDLKVTQKGNALNKSHYTVLTFTNKAMALHAVKMLDGTNQRDTIGTNPLKLAMMLSRYQRKMLSRKKSKLLKKQFG
jgi:hypothetical protein